MPFLSGGWKPTLGTWLSMLGRQEEWLCQPQCPTLDNRVEKETFPRPSRSGSAICKGSLRQPRNCNPPGHRNGEASRSRRYCDAHEQRHFAATRQTNGSTQHGTTRKFPGPVAMLSCSSLAARTPATGNSSSLASCMRATAADRSSLRFPALSL